MADVNRELTEEESKAFSRMLQTIRTKRQRNMLRSAYNDSKKRLDKMGFSIPPHMRDFESALGWPNKAVKVPARRWKPEDFTSTRTSELIDDVREIMADPGVLSLEIQAAEASMEHSVSFVFVGAGDVSAGEPEVVITARTALEATCETDPRTMRTTFALELITRQKFLMYVPGKVLRLEMGEKEYRVTAEYRGIGNLVMCTPYIWGKSLERPFGVSRISRPVMSFTDQGIRTMLRQEVNAEFYGAPQRTLMGADDAHFRDRNGKRISPFDALMGGVWALPDTRDDETGELVRPKLEQLVQATMQPHGDMLRTIAMQVSSETSIPVSYLGVIHDNPASADAIRATESDLVSVIEAELPNYGASRVQVARHVAAIIAGEWTAAMERDFRGLQSQFRDPGTATTAQQADAGQKYVAAFPEGDPAIAMKRFGLKPQEIEQNLAYMKKQGAVQSVLDVIRSRQPQQVEPGSGRPALVGTVDA